ncbi:hypothetical protein J7E88_13000 [Streptomyces sp. ISL-10]|uniref:hypothetical protein n=1 Tax=Streptomyces sp. ISL-10 TaxID=2819172 RepID=UPI001BE7C84E|nr:hypothetical protein [Streptomyces sp. ISL-10]MBT2366202.1 hypothetical protein [Streptomyces sp. ISL-10]
MTYGRGVQLLSEQIGVEPDHVARALRIATRTHAAIQATRYGQLTAEQFRRLIDNDHYTVAIVGNLAMRLAGRIEDAHLLMDVYKASVGATVHRPVIREGVGTLPQFHNHPRVQQVIRILQAADLPPIHTDGTRELAPGFQVDPGCEDEMPGWVFIQPDPDAEHRTGFAGGRLGYLAVMRWAGWGVITEPLPGGLWAACHPDYRNNPFPS